MGMDISGLNPKITGTEPVFPSNWDELSEKAQSFYWELKNDYERDNPGIYFRSNVWWWRTLWDYTCEVCWEILSEKDINAGQWNDGHKISKTKTINSFSFYGLIKFFIFYSI